MTSQVHVHGDVLSMCMCSIDWPSLMELMEMVSSLASDEDNELPKTSKNLSQRNSVSHSFQVRQIGER